MSGGAIVFVRHHTGGSKIPIEVTVSETVDQLREKAAGVFKIRPQQCKLCFHGQALESGTLADHGVGSEAVVDVEPGATRENLKYMAKVAENTETYDYMWECMKGMALMEQPLDTEESNLFSVAAKNRSGPVRVGLRELDGMEKREIPEEHRAFFEQFRAREGERLLRFTNEVKDVATEQVVRQSSARGRAFWYKLVGDQHRMQAESPMATKSDCCVGAKKHYRLAYDAAMELPSTDPVRLGVALNFSVHLRELEEDSEAACKMAKEAFDDAISHLDSLGEDDYKDSTLIMQLLRDNLTLWTTESDDD
eukprot:Hpha_TRINITY_DN15915_c5_g15::TRINITY_DN15915_c5_g15_i1::g.73308::m.73308/K06630/YWHAE; 14-3-3 protein epsilon